MVELRVSCQSRRTVAQIPNGAMGLRTPAIFDAPASSLFVIESQTRELRRELRAFQRMPCSDPVRQTTRAFAFLALALAFLVPWRERHLVSHSNTL